MILSDQSVLGPVDGTTAPPPFDAGERAETLTGQGVMLVTLDQIALNCLAEWFIAVGRRLGRIPPAGRARFVQPPLSVRAEPTAGSNHNTYSVNIETMSEQD